VVSATDPQGRILGFLDRMLVNNNNAMALVRERTTPTERPPLVGEVSANFCGLRVLRSQRNGSPRPYCRIS
jgi:hypothetical protein